MSETAASLKWTHSYGFYRAKVGQVGELVVGFVDGAFRVSAFGARLKEPSPDHEHGKARAIALAKKLLAEASAALPD